MLGAVSRTVAFAAVIATVGILASLFAVTGTDKELGTAIAVMVLSTLFWAFFLRGENFDWDGDSGD